MTQPFADALTWMPKSRSLGTTLSRAYDLTRALGHAEISLEHMLQALVEDPDASALLLGCNVDLLKLNTDVDALLRARPTSGSDQPQIAPGLTIILEYAAAAARQSKRSDVNGAIVLAAMVGEGKSDAARLLTASGLKFQDAITALKRSAQSKPTIPEPPAAAPPPLPVPTSDHAAVPPETEATGTLAGAATSERTGAEPVATAPSTGTPRATMPVAAAPVTATQQATGPTPVAVAPGHASQPNLDEDDPITAARRRVAALRTHPAPSHLAPPPPPLPALARAAASGDTWAPQPDTGGATASAGRATRMPPPVPPMPIRPPQVNGNHAARSRVEAGAGATARAPWADTAPADSEPEAIVQPMAPPSAAILGAAIDIAELGEALPYRMRDGVASTIEILIPRSALLATVAALGSGGRDQSVTRALTVRLKSPSGGLHVEVSAPETQWFDTRKGQRNDDEARWRWIVTPHQTGSRTLQLSVSIRTIAADGTILETALPDHQAAVKVVTNLRNDMRGLGRALLAVSAGAMLALLANGGFAKIFGVLLN